MFNLIVLFAFVNHLQVSNKRSSKNVQWNQAVKYESI